MEGMRLTSRLAALGIAVALFAVVIMFRLYDLQIVNGGDYYRESEKKITRSVNVPAARGEIVDRYGRKLVSNRVGYNVTFDRSLLPSGSENEVIYKLITTLRERGAPYSHGLPIEYTPGGHRFIDGASTTRLDTWLTKMKMTVTSVDDIAAALIAEFKVEGLSPADALEVAAIRWELDLRSARIGMNIADYVIAYDVDTDLIATVVERGLTGVNIVTASVRRYETSAAANIIGRIGPIFDTEYAELKQLGYALNDTVGKDGAEKAFESWLRGKNGTQLEERNSQGKVTGVVYSTPPDPGGNVMLTLDIRLQEAAEAALANRIKEIRELGEQGSSQGAADVAGGAVVVMDVKNFEILAAANYPTYSLENFNTDYAALLEDPLTPMVNRAFVGRYAPGSTFKMATATAALETGVITSRTYIVDKGVYMLYAPGYTPACEIWLTSRSTHGSINVVDALRVSCNYFFYEAGQLTGIERLNYYAAQFGFGSPTGIELPESSGKLAGRETREAAGGTWYGGDTLQAAIGQSDNLATPLQLASYISALVTGERKQAHLLKSVKTFDYSGTLYDASPEFYNAIELSDANRSIILRGMLEVARRGSAAAVFGSYPMDVGAKTGTAQTGEGSAYGIFVAFAPYDNPEIAVAIVVEHAGKGSRIGNIARDIFDAYFRIGCTFDTVEGENTLIN